MFSSLNKVTNLFECKQDHEYHLNSLMKNRGRIWDLISAPANQSQSQKLLLLKEEKKLKLVYNGRLSVVQLRKEFLTLRNELTSSKDKVQELTNRNAFSLTFNKLMCQKVKEEEKQFKDEYTVSDETVELQTVSKVASKSKGLRSSLEIGNELKEFWYPLEFSRTLDTDTLVPLDLFDLSWVLFRNNRGQPSCIKD